MNNGAAIVAAPASRLRRGPPASTDTDRPAYTVAIAIVMQSVRAGQTNRHAVAVRADIGTGKERRDKPATRSNQARAAVVGSRGLVPSPVGPGFVLRIVRPAS